MAKKVTVELIDKYLNKHGWSKHMSKDEAGEKEGLVLTGWGGISGSHVVAIDPMSEKGALSFMVPKILNAPRDGTPADRLTGLLMALGKLNYKMIIGKFGYDPTDGEVMFQIALPIDENDLTYEQFEHCLQVLVSTIEVESPVLKGIVDGSMSVEDALSKVWPS